jgi:transcriptional regulator with XRE-family HTH domain
MPTSRIKRTQKLDPKEQKRIMGRVRDRMNELGLGVADLFGDGSTPGRSDISRTAYYSYESAKRPVDMEVLRELERVLRLPAGELLKMAGFLPAGLDDFAREPGAVLVAIEVDPDLTPEEKDALRTIYQGFAAKPKRVRRPSPTVH